MSQSAHQQDRDKQDRDKQDTASGSRLPPWGVIKRLFSFKTHSLSIGSWVARSLPPVELLSGSASCPTTPRFVSTLSLGPSSPLRLEAWQPACSWTHLPGAVREQRGRAPRWGRVLTGALSLASSDLAR